MLGFLKGKLRSLILQTPTTVDGASALVGYTSNIASAAITPTIVTNDVAKNLLFIYDTTAGNVNHITPFKRGIEFTASDIAAASIKTLLPNATSTYVVFIEPLAFPLGPGHTPVKGNVTPFIVDQMEQRCEFGRDYLDAMVGTGKGYIPWTSEIQVALLDNKAALGGIIPILPTGAEFSLSNNITYVSAPADILAAPLHMLTLKRLDDERANIIKSQTKDDSSSSGGSNTTDIGTQIINISDSFALWQIVSNTNSLS